MKFFTVYSLTMGMLLSAFTMHSMEKYIKDRSPEEQCSRNSKDPEQDKGEQYTAMIGLMHYELYYESPCGARRLSNEMNLADYTKSVPSNACNTFFP